MRTVSFSDPTVGNTLASKFISTYTNTQGTANTGMSFSHSPDEPPGPCGRGAGRQNVQTVFMTPAGKIYHVATGFLSPDDLQAELEFASETYRSLRQSRDPGLRLVGLQSERMSELGFSPTELQTDNLMQELTTMFSPSDLGIRMPSRSPLGDVGRNRMLRDAKFVVQNPLIDRHDFEQDPTRLVGQHKSFFGSNALMNGLNNSMQRVVNQRPIRP